MKRIFLLAVIFSGVLIHSNAQDSFKRKYVTASSESVTTLQIDGNINVTLVVAPNEPSVYIDGSENFTKKVKTSFIDGVMKISAYASSRSENDVVVIYAPGLSHLELNGDVKFKTIGTISAKNLQVSINGNCKLLVQHAGKINIRLDDNYEFIEKKVTRLKAS